LVVPSFTYITWLLSVKHYILNSSGSKLSLLIFIVVCTDHTDVLDNGTDQSSVSVVLVGYDSSRPCMSEPCEVPSCRCNGHFYAPRRHKRGIIRRQYPPKPVQFFIVLYSPDAIRMFGPNILSRIFLTKERISCLAHLGKVMFHSILKD
jgi:hypothetical protein